MSDNRSELASSGKSTIDPAELAKFIEPLFKLSPLLQLVVIQSLLQQSKGVENGKLIEAVAVNALNQSEISMYGRRVKNTLNPKAKDGQRVQYDVHPYSKEGSGVAMSCIYYDPKQSEFYILLSQKRRDRSYWEQIAGFTRGHWPEGGEVNVDTRSEAERDRQEEKVIGFQDAVQVDKKIKKMTISGYTLEQAKKLVDRFFQEKLQQNPNYDFKINPLEIKAFFKESGLNMTTDYNALETAIRELKEETGLTPDVKQFIELSTVNDFAITNPNPKLQVKATRYLVYLGEMTEPPSVKPGSDIGALQWVPISKIEASCHNGKTQVQYDGKNIRLDYATTTLSEAIKAAKNLLIQKFSQNKLSTVDNLKAWIPLLVPGKTAEDILGKTPVNHYNQESQTYYLRALTLTKALGKMKQLRSFNHETVSQWLALIKQQQPEEYDLVEEQQLQKKPTLTIFKNT